MQMQIDEAVKILKEAISLEGTERGEMWEHLIHLYESYESYMSHDLYVSVVVEIIKEATTIKRDFEIIEVKHTTREYTTRELVEKKK